MYNNVDISFRLFTDTPSDTSSFFLVENKKYNFFNIFKFV